MKISFEDFNSSCDFLSCNFDISCNFFYPATHFNFLCESFVFKSWAVFAKGGFSQMIGAPIKYIYFDKSFLSGWR